MTEKINFDGFTERLGIINRKVKGVGALIGAIDDADVQLAVKEIYEMGLEKGEIKALEKLQTKMKTAWLANAGQVETLPTDSMDLIDMWAKKFRDGAGKIFRKVAEIYPNELSKEELGEMVGQVFTGGTFNTYLSELRRAGLIEIEGSSVKATQWLFGVRK